MATLKVNVMKSYCEMFELTLPLSTTVGGIKSAVSQNHKIKRDNQYLTYLGRLLKDDEKAASLRANNETLRLRLVLKDQPRSKVAEFPRPPKFHIEDEKETTHQAAQVFKLHVPLNLENNNIAQVIHLRGHVRPQGQAAAPPVEEAQPAQPDPAQAAPPQPAPQPARQGIRGFWLFRFINFFLLIRLVLFFHIFARGEPQIQTILFFACAGYYLWRVGFVDWIRRKFFPNRRRNNNNARGDRHVVIDRPLTRRDLIERFIIGLFASLFPMWRPPVVRVRQHQNQEVQNDNAAVNNRDDDAKADDGVLNGNNDQHENVEEDTGNQEGEPQHEHQD